MKQIDKSSWIVEASRPGPDPGPPDCSGKKAPDHVRGAWCFATMLCCILGLTIAVFAPPGATAAHAADRVTAFPKIPVENCRGGRAKLYNECHAQQPIFDKALRTARGQGKVLLVSLGAEWCIWCHVFHAYVVGEHDVFTHLYSDEEDRRRYSATIYERAKKDVSEDAAELARFTAENFVLVHIDSRYAEDGWEVLDRANATPHYQNWIPFLFSVDGQGRFAAALEHDRVEVRRESDDWFRGYDRARLMEELARLRNEATVP